MKVKSRSYTKAHSGAGSGSKSFGANMSKSATRPPFATHGSAPNKSVKTSNNIGTATGKVYS